MPPDLLEFQRDFAAALDKPAIGAMAVYRNTVLNGAVEALRANYPVVEQILGNEMFESLAVDHASQCPPREPVLALYGEGFAEWLEEQPWIGDLPYLPDVARVERLRIEALMAAEAEPLSREQLAGGAALSELELRLHPALRFGWLATPAMSIWLAHQQSFVELNPEWKAEGALFARPTPFVMHAPRIGAAAYRILLGVRHGETIGHSIAAARALHPEEDCDALFASLVNLGAFAAPPLERPW